MLLGCLASSKTRRKACTSDALATVKTRRYWDAAPGGFLGCALAVKLLRRMVHLLMSSRRDLPSPALNPRQNFDSIVYLDSIAMTRTSVAAGVPIYLDKHAELEKARRDLEGQSLEASSTAQAVQFITIVQSCKRQVKGYPFSCLV